MISFLFWNTHSNQSINAYLEEIIIENSCDIIVLAEYSDDENALCNNLSLSNKDFRAFNIVGCRKIKIVANHFFEQDMIRDESGSYTIQNVKFFGNQLLLVAVHFPSKYHGDKKAEREQLSRKLIKDVEDAEKEVEHSNTIIIGDFNANPFEEVMTNANCMHSLSNMQISKKNRKVSFETYRTFYNPMWNLFGDFNCPSGTYYYPKSGMTTYFWNIFDQVLFRPKLARSLDNDSLKIITRTTNLSLTDEKGIPDIDNVSDHLPIYFKIKENL